MHSGNYFSHKTYKKYRITGSKITPIACDFLTFMKDASMPMGVEIIKMKSPKNPVKSTTISVSPMSTPAQSLL
jgi:hypothetical protein